MNPRKRKPSEQDFERALKRLETIVKTLEEEETSLESSLKLFAEGQELARACEAKLQAAENQIKKLVEDASGQIREVEFDVERDDSDEETGDAENGDLDESAEEISSQSGDKAEPPNASSKDDLPF